MKILAVLKANYSEHFRDMRKIDAEALINLWTESFCDTPYDIVSAGVMAFISTDTKGYMPKVGMINEQIRKLTAKEQMTEQEAISLILKATRNGLYGAKEEFDKLPPILQRLVGSPEQIRSWSLMTEDDIQTVVASNLMRSYRVVAKQEEYKQTLPASLKVMLETTADKLRLDRGI
jgi:hypothetical protein